MNNLNFNLLLGNELYTLAKKTVEITTGAVSAHGVKNPILNELVSKCAHSFEKYDEAFMKQTASITTQEIAECDSLFDDAFVAWRYILRAYALHPDEKLKKAADYLLLKIRNHGWGIQTMNYTRQLAQGSDLINEIKNDTNAQNAICTLDDNTWFSEVEKTHGAFEKAISKRDAQNAETTDIDPAMAKRNLRTDLRNMFDFLDVVYQIQPAEYNELINRINEAIDTVMAQAKARQTRNKNANLETEN